MVDRYEWDQRVIDDFRKVAGNGAMFETRDLGLVFKWKRRKICQLWTYELNPEPLGIQMTRSDSIKINKGK